ncbi:MAG TPA: phosphatidate cytidylyltransferase [Bacteroidales bacterium]|nr:phosphatidate cytidylyltransferase [Bacteroidales bacterium]
MNNFFRRTLTGAWIVIFVLGGFWLHPLTFVLAGLVILAGTQYEYLIMIRNTGVKPQLVPGMITGTASYLLATLIAAGILPVKFFLVLIPVMLFIMIVELYRRQEKPFDSLAHTFFSVLYTGIPLSMFPFAAFSRSGLDSILPHRLEMFSPGIIIGFFLLIWANDTGAYLAGVSFGKHKLFERISPKKTWEGFFGGVLLVVIVAWLLSSWLGVVGRTQWIIIALIVSVAGTYGDLIESMLKRSLGVKDSGNIMPGHGGFLDRFDSAIISFPLVYLFIALFG